MKGITIGTYTRWRKEHGQSVPTKAELRAISDAEVEAIYCTYYWLPSGADDMAWPMCALQFDAAVNTGVQQAKVFHEDAGDNVLRYMARRLTFYTGLKTFGTFGAGWVNRVADLMKLAAG